MNKPSEARAKGSAVLSRSQLDRSRSWVERISAFVVLLVSFAGTIAAISGGWTSLIDHPRLAPIIGGVALQGVLTAIQWWYGAGRGPWRYRISLCADAAFTTLGYGPLIVPWMVSYFNARGAGELSDPLAWGIAGLAAVAVAWYPERTLID